MHFSAPAPHITAPTASFAAAGPRAVGVTSGPAWTGGRATWNGGGGTWNGGGWHHHHHGFFPGAVAAGVIVGGALAANAYYDNGYYGPAYYDNSYYDNGGYYDDGGTVAVVPAEPAGGDAASCAQTYRSYDPASGTYLGYDGQRHPCP
jgi:hypothetical protein